MEDIDVLYNHSKRKMAPNGLHLSADLLPKKLIHYWTPAEFMAPCAPVRADENFTKELESVITFS